jgi:hypothetical protein
MADKIPTKAEIQEELEQAETRNADLAEENQALMNKQADMEERLARMEALIEGQRAEGTYAGPQPKVYHDPYDTTNPHKILHHPEGKKLSWKNPNIRDRQGWKGWEPITWDSEVGKNIEKYIPSPPAKMVGIEKQDNYVRRGTDSVLAMIDEEIWMARQQKREDKALRKQLAANARANAAIGNGVETFGDGVQSDPRPAGGFKPRQELPVPEGGHRTRLLHPDEE